MAKWSEEEFELARTNFEHSCSALDKLIKCLHKISDSFKVSMWPMMDLAEAMKDFLGSGLSFDLENPTADYLKEMAEQVNSLKAYQEQQKTFKEKIEQREKLRQQNRSNDSASGAKTRAALEEFDAQLKDDLVGQHYSRYRRIAPELHKYVQTQLKLMKCVNENLNGMSEFLASKCRGEEDLDWTVKRNSLKKSSRKDKTGMASSSQAVLTTVSFDSTLAPKQAPGSPIPPPRNRIKTSAAPRDPPPVPPKNRANTYSRSHIVGPAKRLPDSSSSSGNYRRSLSQGNLKLTLSDVLEASDDKERSLSVDDSKEINELRNALIDSGTIRGSEKKMAIPAPAYPRPQGVAPPPSRPLSTQVPQVDVGRQKDPSKLASRRRPPLPPVTSTHPQSLSSALISSVAIPSLAGASTAQSADQVGEGSSPPESLSHSPPPIPSPLNKPKITATRALAADDPQWVNQPRRTKGTTGVTPTVVAERRNFWKGMDSQDSPTH